MKGAQNVPVLNHLCRGLPMGSMGDVYACVQEYIFVCYCLCGSCSQVYDGASWSGQQHYGGNGSGGRMKVKERNDSLQLIWPVMPCYDSLMCAPGAHKTDTSPLYCLTPPPPLFCSASPQSLVLCLPLWDDICLYWLLFCSFPSQCLCPCFRHSSACWI